MSKPELPKPSMFFGHSTALPMYGEEEMLAYGLACYRAGLLRAADICASTAAGVQQAADACCDLSARCDILNEQFGALSCEKAVRAEARGRK